MRKIFLLVTSVISIAFFVPASAFAADNSLAKRLNGRILLQVESYGRAWYVNPTNNTRYYLKDGATAYKIMSELGLGISNTNLAKIPTDATRPRNSKLASRLSGRILLQVESRGEAWYVNPTDNRRYYLKDGEAAYKLMKKFALGVSNADLRAITMNSTQIVQDTAFDDVAYVLLRDGKIISGKNENQILPPASMSKLITALVLLDQTPANPVRELTRGIEPDPIRSSISNGAFSNGVNWDQAITITQAQLDYPASLVGDDTTSEVKLQNGDVVSAYDLWVSMLVASSNQATIALVDSSGLSRKDFVKAMNQKAENLGLKRTRFYDPTGLDAHNVTTPYEMAIIAKAAFSKPEISQTTLRDDYTISTRNTPPREIKVNNHNASLRIYQPDAVKVGFLVEAQRCVALKKGEDIIVVMHARSMKERNRILDKLTK